ncbi:unnamed protein product [Urochloa humidicola]
MRATEPSSVHGGSHRDADCHRCSSPSFSPPATDTAGQRSSSALAAAWLSGFHSSALSIACFRPGAITAQNKLQEAL